MSEKMSKQVEAQIADLNSRLEESQRTIQELQSSKARLQVTAHIMLNCMS